MYQVGDVVQSERSLVRCFSKAVAVAGSDGLMVASTDPKQLTPNTGSVGADRVFGKFNVYDGDVFVGRVNCVNTDESRANSLWKITAVDVDGSGHGDSHNVSGMSSVWSKYTCTAVRIDSTGVPHQSGEVLTFSNGCDRYVKDLKRVKLN